VSLRTRLLLALLATSVLTLVAAALALLSPLQDRLQDQARRSLRATALATRPAVEASLRNDGNVVSFRTVATTDTLASRTGASVVLYDEIPQQRYPSTTSADAPPPEVYKALVSGATTDTLASRTGASVVLYDEIPQQRYPSTTSADAPPPEVYKALVSGATTSASPPGGATSFAVPLFPRGRRGPPWVLLVRGTDATVDDAVDEVRRALLAAAGVGLGVALLLGLALSTGLVRRLGRLRRAALRMAAEGPEAPVLVDDRADEVGDLARALASMQEALRRQEEARRAFVATASHELRTPLTSLQGNLELLTEDLDAGHLDVEEAGAVLRGAQGQLRRLSNLASELLDLSRLDAGVELRREPVELGELSRAVAAEFELRTRDRSVALEVVPPTGPVWAAGDPGAVARVARILIDNALRFSPAGEAIRVTAAYHCDRATLEVADRGPGVLEHEGELIFERFQRGTRTGGEGGFGLGLAIGRELARRLDGELALAPAAGRPGARFMLTLPIELPRGSVSDAGEAGEAPAGAPAAPTVD
jgi:signal transduction histidine kinase